MMKKTRRKTNMKTTREMAEDLYNLLMEDSGECSDVVIDLYDDMVTYEDQAGQISIEFDRKIISLSGNIEDTFCSQTRQEVAENYTNDNTLSIEFYKTRFDSLHATVCNEYETFEELETAMKEDYTLFTYLDLGKVFD